MICNNILIEIYQSKINDFLSFSHKILLFNIIHIMLEFFRSYFLLVMAVLGKLKVMNVEMNEKE